ncbi:unnamed protein product [Trifolium pratense]|uniref:Uncharacterized protein n=1 Tax=Trifolium pratense TaxID=57577 RepID=A0ACB0L2Y1_TRIPR|nr:unnamed protein product [Trifolium pratense]
MASYIVLAEPPEQNLRRYVVYVGEDSIDATYHQGNSTKPRIIITVTATASAVTQWLSTVLRQHRQTLSAHQLVVGLGVQWTNYRNNNNTSTTTTTASTSTRNNNNNNNNNQNHFTTDTLQLCIGNECLIFQLKHADMIPENLRKLLLHRDNTFVGFWNNGDRWRLSRSKHCLELFRYPMDLRYKAYIICNENLSLANLDEIALKCLGFQVEQRTDTAMSNWGQLNLDLDQIAYASIDAFCAYKMGVSIEAWRYKDD